MAIMLTPMPNKQSQEIDFVIEPALREKRNFLKSAPAEIIQGYLFKDF